MPWLQCTYSAVYLQCSILTVQFNVNLCYVVPNYHSNSVLKELKLMDLPRATFVRTLFLFMSYLSQPCCFSQFFPSLFIHLLICIKLNLYQHDLMKTLNSYSQT